MIRPVCGKKCIRKESVVSPNGHKSVTYVHKIIDRGTYKVAEGCGVE